MSLSPWNCIVNWWSANMMHLLFKGTWSAWFFFLIKKCTSCAWLQQRVMCVLNVVIESALVHHLHLLHKKFTAACQFWVISLWMRHALNIETDLVCSWWFWVVFVADACWTLLSSSCKAHRTMTLKFRCCCLWNHKETSLMSHFSQVEAVSQLCCHILLCQKTDKKADTLTQLNISSYASMQG